MNEEPAILINGTQLNTAQAMTLRVALSSFLHDLSEGDFMKDLGEIGPAYQARAREVIKIMLGYKP